jgi:cobalt/nickel transport system permease protein
VGGPTHGHTLYRQGGTVIHRLPAEVKVVAAVLFAVMVVATPRERFAAFGAYAVLVLTGLVVARLPAGWVARRALIEVPFVVLALLLPFTGGAPHVELLGVTVSEHGALSGWNILAKGTLGVLTSILLASTTPVRELLMGLERLHLPPVLVHIAAFMVRYLDVVLDQARRMRIARISRGHDPRFLWQVSAFARSIGSLFIRSFERGERVYLAMVSRGYAGSMPQLSDRTATAREWATALSLPFAAGAIMVWSWTVR